MVAIPYKALIVTAYALLLGGCATFSAPPKQLPEVYTFRYDLRLDPSLPTLGHAQWSRDEGYCIVTLREYPTCLLHELRHCLEGHWHDKRPNDEDCYDG